MNRLPSWLILVVTILVSGLVGQAIAPAATAQATDHNAFTCVPVIETPVEGPTQYQVALLKNNPGPDWTGGEAEDWTTGEMNPKQIEPNAYLGYFTKGRTISLYVRVDAEVEVDKFQLKIAKLGDEHFDMLTSYDENKPNLPVPELRWTKITTLTIPEDGNYMIYYWVRLEG